MKRFVREQLSAYIFAKEPDLIALAEGLGSVTSQISSRFEMVLERDKSVTVRIAQYSIGAESGPLSVSAPQASFIAAFRNSRSQMCSPIGVVDRLVKRITDGCTWLPCNYQCPCASSYCTCCCGSLRWCHRSNSSRFRCGSGSGYRGCDHGSAQTIFFTSERTPTKRATS